MIQGHIYIHGTIGSYTNEKGVEVKGVELLDVIAQVKSQPKANSFLVHIGSPGGLVDAGDQIYDYLQSLKTTGINVDTVSDSYIDTETSEMKSGVGSIASKIFLAGTDRAIVDGHDGFIHNPWTSITGDTVKVKAELKGLEQEEARLRAFYQQHLNIGEVGLKALMDNETSINSDYAVAIGFATRKIASKKIKAFAQLNNNNMSKDNLTIGQKIDDLKSTISDFLTGKAKALAADPATPGDEPATDPNSLPDGEYPLADGRILVVSGGQISEVKMPAAAVAPNALPTTTPAPAAVATPSLAEKALQDKVAALEAANAKQADDLATAMKGLDDFKNTLVSGKSPARAFNNNGNNGAAQTWTHKSIAQVMSEKQEERKKQLNKN